MRGRQRRTDLINVEAEQGYIAWLLLHGGEPGIADRIVADRITAADFWCESYSRVFSAALLLAADDLAVDTITVRDKLEELGTLDIVGGPDALMAITDTIPLQAHASLIRRLAAQRRVQLTARIAAESVGTTREAESLHLLELAKDALRDIRRERDELNEPCPGDPLRGCPRLRLMAVMGLDHILALASAPVSYAWVDIAVAGTIVLLAGGPSEGKTTLLFLLLAARAAIGGRVQLLGRDVEPAPEGRYLLLIEGEHSESSTARKLIRSLEILGVPQNALNRVIIVARKSLTIGSPAWDEVTSLVRAGLVSDIAIDTIARCSPADANDEAAQVQIFSALADCIEAAPNPDARPTVWMVAHTRKGSSGELGDVSGSAQRVGQADSVLIVKGTKVKGRTVSSRVTFQKLREEPDEYPSPVDFTLQRDVVDGHVTLQTTIAPAEDLDMSTSTLPPPPPAGHTKSIPQLVFELLQSRGPLTKRAIRAALPYLSGARVDAAVSALNAERRLTKGWVHVQGQRRQVYGLTSECLQVAE